MLNRNGSRPNQKPHDIKRTVLRLSLVVLTLLSSGCPVTQSLPEQAAIQERTERRTECSYQLYVPSIYDDGRTWPLVVACHGTWPWDTAEYQMREWAKFAEYEGIIVAAPRLVSTEGGMPPPPEKQRKLQREDDTKILAVVSEIKRKYKIAEERVFLTGWSAGAFPILHSGLNHPDIFRALYVRQGNFDERFMDVPDDRLDKWQQIKVVFGKTDMLRDQTRGIIKWLRNQGMFVTEEEVAGFHRRIDPNHAWRFFEKVVKERPWIRIRTRTTDTSKPLTVRFAVDAIPKATKQKWFFGDGETSYEASPVHTYQTPGQYEIRLNVALEGDSKFSRTKILRVIRKWGPE
ncbi:MAG: PKD domain-containing protein [Phycisphaerales bacterium]|nr:PKD domain-containing protein [Phycisphaerales bacterium]